MAKEKIKNKMLIVAGVLIVAGMAYNVKSMHDLKVTNETAAYGEVMTWTQGSVLSYGNILPRVLEGRDAYKKTYQKAVFLTACATYAQNCSFNYSTTPEQVSKMIEFAQAITKTANSLNYGVICTALPSIVYGYANFDTSVNGVVIDNNALISSYKDVMKTTYRLKV
jgi:hypothetical protein